MNAPGGSAATAAAACAGREPDLLISAAISPATSAADIDVPLSRPNAAPPFSPAAPTEAESRSTPGADAHPRAVIGERSPLPLPGVLDVLDPDDGHDALEAGRKREPGSPVVPGRRDDRGAVRDESAHRLADPRVGLVGTEGQQHDLGRWTRSATRLTASAHASGEAAGSGTGSTHTSAPGARWRTSPTTAVPWYRSTECSVDTPPWTRSPNHGCAYAAGVTTATVTPAPTVPVSGGSCSTAI